MSVGGPSALGTLLAQRLDAVLGITLSQQSNIATGARPDAVAQPDHALDAGMLRDETLRHPRETVDRAAAQTERQPATGKAALDPAAGQQADADTGTANSVASAPTILGRTAQAILALLNIYPDPAPPLRGAAPLLARPLAPGAVDPDASPPSPTAAQPFSRETQPTARTNTTASSADAANAPSSNAGTARAGAAQAASGASGPLAHDLAQALRVALEYSGLFYEAHLDALLCGQRSAAALRQEPQALLGAPPEQPGPDPGQAQAAPSASGAQSAGSKAGETAAGSATLPGPPPGTGSGTAAIHAGAAQAAAGSGVPGSSGALAMLHPESHLLVRQQLDALANQAIEWQGPAWPGADMRWRVERREQSNASGEAFQHWASRLTLELPRLGTVQARLTLAGNSLALQLGAPQAAALLGEASAGLRARLLGCGLQLSHLSIAADPLPDEGRPGNAEAAP